MKILWFFFFLLPIYVWQKFLSLNFLFCKPGIIILSTSCVGYEDSIKKLYTAWVLVRWLSFISLITTTLWKFHMLPHSGTGRLCMEKSPLNEFNIIPMDIPKDFTFKTGPNSTFFTWKKESNIYKELLCVDIEYNLITYVWHGICWIA